MEDQNEGAAPAVSVANIQTCLSHDDIQTVVGSRSSEIIAKSASDRNLKTASWLNIQDKLPTKNLQ
jgi:hypothetical protein